MSRTLWLTLLILALPTVALAQENDTVARLRVSLDEVVVTATRTPKRLQDIPARVNVIPRDEIERIPFSNIDDLLKTTANVNVNRSWGIFSKNSSVTMHGLPGSSRTLVLQDGFPKNKIGGGSVNWHNIYPDNLERIEVIQGPASALYGNNAMGGVINLISRKPLKPFEGSFRINYGSYNSIGTSARIAGSQLNENKGLYWSVDGFYRKGDGYYLDPPEYLDPTDVKTNLKEYGSNIMTGYSFGKAGTVDFYLDYYNELRGAGRQIHVEGGSYEATVTSSVRAKYQGRLAGGELAVLAYYMNEDYHGQKESLSETNEYRLLDSYTLKQDQGVWTSWSKRILPDHNLTTGAEWKTGFVSGQDLYATSTDEIRFGSRMDILGLFVQDEISFRNKKLRAIAGFRADWSSFRDGFQTIKEPTSVTGFTEGFSENFDPNRWFSLSPKLSLQYSFTPVIKAYIAAGTGYIPPDLKDLSQTGKINKGFRLANPNLKPETLVNFETGYSWLITEQLKMSGSYYYSTGYNFQYMIGTGDSIDTGGSSLKPVLVMENLARVRILGADLSVRWLINRFLVLDGGYAWNDSRIVKFGKSEINPDKDLTGKYMIEVSPNQFFTGLTFRYRNFSANLNANYVGHQWFDDENSILIDDYFVANFRIAQTIRKHYRIWLDIQNILDHVYIDRKGQVSPGRYMTAGLQFIW
jgi:iron complex outermembrane receptor protein